MPIKSSGALLEKGALKLGLHPQPAPVAILSRPYRGRPPCGHCGFCMGFGCEANAKSSTLAAMIPLAEATGRCEIRPLSTVFRIETNAAGRVSEVAYVDGHGRQQGGRGYEIGVVQAHPLRLLGAGRGAGIAQPGDPGVRGGGTDGAAAFAPVPRGGHLS